jgi:hypothetical protein
VQGYGDQLRGKVIGELTGGEPDLMEWTEPSYPATTVDMFPAMGEEGLNFLQSLPEILKFKPIPNIVNDISMDSNLPTLVQDNLLQILSMSGSMYPQLSRGLMGTFVNQLCFEAVSEREIVNIITEMQNSPEDSRFEIGFTIVTNDYSFIYENQSVVSVPLKLYITVLGNGRLRCHIEDDSGEDEHEDLLYNFTTTFTIHNPQSLVDMLMNTGTINAKSLLCFVPAPSSLSALINNRTMCNSIPNYKERYYNTFIDSLIHMKDINSSFVIDVLSSNIWGPDEDITFITPQTLAEDLELMKK